MADKKDEPKQVIDTTDGSAHAFVDAPKDDKPVEVKPDVSGLPKAEDMASPFVTDRSVTNETLLKSQPEGSVGDTGPEERHKESNLYKTATFYSAENTYEQGAIESEFDDGTVDIMLGTGPRRRVHLSTGKDDSEYPCVKLGAK